MSPLDLLEELKTFIENVTKDLILEVRPVKLRTIREPGAAKETEQMKERPAEVHLMRLPSKDAETNRIPYVLLQLLTGADTQQAGEPPDGECKVRIVCATYSEDKTKGAIDLLNLITRIRINILKVGIIGKDFILRKPLEYVCYPDDTGEYYLGEIITIWGIPTIQREVDLYVEN